MLSLFYTRHRRLILVVFLLAFPFVVYGAHRARLTNENRVEDWLPKHFEETERLYWFAQHFGSDELLMISWKGCTLDDQRLGDLAEKLVKPVQIDAYTRAAWFRRVFTGPEVLEELMSPPLELTRDEALERLEGWLVGPDRHTTCAVALVSRAGFDDREGAVHYVYQCAERVDGLSREMLHAAGTTIESVAINEASGRSLPRLTPISLVICFAIMYLAFRSIALALMVFTTAVFTQQLSMALMYFTGSPMDSVSLMVPTLVYVLGISAGVHLVNYYQDAIFARGLDGAPRRAVGYAWRPCGLASVTTALGLFSLLVSQLTPVRKFGLYSALGVICGLAVLFLLLPSELEQFPPRRWASRRGRVDPETTRGRWNRFSGFVTQYHAAIALAGIVLLAFTGWGVTRIQASARLHNLFAPGTRVLEDYAWLERTIGPLVPVEVVVRIPRSDPSTMLERFQLVGRIRGQIDEVPAVKRSLCAEDFAPQLPNTAGGGARQVIRRTVANKRLLSERQRFIELRYLQETPDEELWRISGRVHAGDASLDYEEVLRQIEQRVSPIVSAAGATAVYSGSIPLVHKAQEQLLHDLMKSFVVAFGVIALAMVVLLRSVPAGLISMIPNLLPSVAVFGTMGLAGIEIEVGSMMTASAALGIAVDDTLHFITWFRRGLEEGKDRWRAIHYAYTRCGTAMVQTSLICSLALFVFALSPFVPIARFAWMMAAMLSGALLADLLILPAILAGPLGAAFQSAPQRYPAEPAASPEAAPGDG